MMSIPENKGKVEAHPDPHAHREVTAPEKAKEKAASVPEQCAALHLKLEAAIAARDKHAIEECWEELDKLFKEHSGSDKAENHNHVVALSRTFHRLAPRKLARVKAIEAGLDAAVAGKDKDRPSTPAKEHPGVTAAKEALADLDAEHAAHVNLPGDDKAIAELREKMAKVPLTDG